MSKKNLILTLLFPPLGLPLGLIGVIYDSKYRKRYVLCIALFFAALGYCYSPTSSTDLVRYFEYVNLLKGQKLTAIFSGNLYADNRVYVFTFLCWVVGNLGVPHLLPAISVFFVYLIGLYLACDIGCRAQAEEVDVFFYILLIVISSNFYAIVNNVRNIFAFSVAIYAAYREMVEKKSKIVSILLYLTASLIHPTALIILGFRIIVALPSTLRYIGIIAVFLTRPLVGIVYRAVANIRMTGIMDTVKTQLITKGYKYFYDTSSEWGLEVQASGSERAFKLLYVFIILVLGAFAIKAIFRLRASKDHRDRISLHFVELCLLIILFTFATVPMLMPEYWRFAAISILTSSGCYFYSLRSRYKVQLRYSLLLLVCGVSPLCLLLWGRNICIYSDEVQLLLKMNVSSPIIVFITSIVKAVL